MNNAEYVLSTTPDEDIFDEDDFMLKAKEMARLKLESSQKWFAENQAPFDFEEKLKEPLKELIVDSVEDNETILDKRNRNSSLRLESLRASNMAKRRELVNRLSKMILNGNFSFELKISGNEADGVSETIEIGFNTVDMLI